MLLIDQFAYINRLHAIHPLEKMTLSMLLLLFSIFVRDEITALVIFIIMSILIVFIAKIPGMFYVKLLLLPAIFLGISLLTIIFSYAKAGDILPPFYMHIAIGNWQFFIGKQSVTMAIELFCVALSSISCLYFLILTTSIQSICHILRKLKVPSLFIDLCEITYRFIFVFLQSTERIYIAQHSRLGYHSRQQQLRSASLLITALFIDVWQRSRQLSNAIQARTVDNTPLYWEESHYYSVKNWGYISIIILFVILIYFSKEVL